MITITYSSKKIIIIQKIY